MKVYHHRRSCLASLENFQRKEEEKTVIHLVTNLELFDEENMTRW